MEQIILASQSPRRRELLAQIGLSYQVIPSTVEEKVTEKDPERVVQELSRQKARDVAWKVRNDGILTGNGRESKGDILVIGADTIVAFQGSILGKPADEEDAVRMLSMLQGHVHSVYTGVTLIYQKHSGQSGGVREVPGDGQAFFEEYTFAEETRVHMYPMTGEEIRWYVETGEPMDKAGAYGIQGLCARFVEKIEGDYNNVVGLPVGRIWQELKKREQRNMEKEGTTDEAERVQS